MWERNHLNSFLVSSISFQHLIIPIKKKKNEIFSIQEKKKIAQKWEKRAYVFPLPPYLHFSSTYDFFHFPANWRVTRVQRLERGEAHDSIRYCTVTL